MEYHAGTDVSLELSSVCVVDATGKIIKETRVASDPVALVGFFRELGFAVTRIGLEAGPLSQWLHAGLAREGFETNGPLRCQRLAHAFVKSPVFSYYNELRTHLSLNKDAPIHRPIHRIGRIIPVPILGGLHHQYCRT